LLSLLSPNCQIALSLSISKSQICQPILTVPKIPIPGRKSQNHIGIGMLSFLGCHKQLALEQGIGHIIWCWFWWSKNTRAGVIGLERRWKSLKFDGETKERITYTESCAKYVPYCEGCSSFDYVMHLEKNNDLQKAKKKNIFFMRISHNNIYILNIILITLLQY